MLAVPYLLSAKVDSAKPHTMSEKRNFATPISLTLAVLCAAWALSSSAATAVRSAPYAVRNSVSPRATWSARVVSSSVGSAENDW